MSLWSYLKSTLVLQLLVGYVWLTSGLCVSFLSLLCYIFIWPFNKSLYRKCVCNLAYSFWCQFTFLGQWWAGSNCTIHCENPDDIHMIGKEHSIVLMNHKYDIDWLMGWILSERMAMLGGTKIYGKSSLRFVPLIGWIWVFTESIFLRRVWESDKKTLVRDLQFVEQYPKDYNVSLLLFCEGTRFTEDKRVASMEIARKKGLPELKHHLLPRTRGFVLSCQGLDGAVPTILDLTVGFRKDGAEPTFMSVVNGLACKAELYVRRIPLDSVPKDDEGCANWLHKTFKEKDDIYDNFVRDGYYKNGTKYEVPRRVNDLLIFILWAVLMWTPLLYYGIGLFYSSFYVQIAVVVSVLLFIVFARKMIAVTEIERGSAYGHDNKSL